MIKSILLVLILISHLSFSQTFTISGYVYDKNTGETLIGATVYETTSMKGTSSNGYGFFSLSLPQGEYSINCSYLGYNTHTFTIRPDADINRNIFLEREGINIDEVVVSAGKSQSPINTNEFNFDKITINDIKKLPVIFGEADLIKAVQLQPGVKTLGDGSSGMFVRGGNSDQNLILIDEAPIYNPSHMFGLISVFNPDAINNITLYKSNMPAQYGGRTSAVLDCKMKEGNMYDYNFSTGISTFSASLFANGPLVKEKSAFLVSARKSIVDLLFKPDQQGMFEIVPGYYDINVKLNTKIGDKDRLYMSFYNGKDRLQSVDGFSNNWGNLIGTLRWNRNLSSKWFSNLSLIYSNYTNDLEFNENSRNYEWHTGVTDLNIKADLSYYISPDNTIKMGVNSIYHKFIPGESDDTLQSIPRTDAIESAVYVLNDIRLNSWLGLNYGIRFSIFQNDGFNSTFEPRISTNIRTSLASSIKLAYARNAQYMQVLQNSSLSYTSLETWFPANANIQPIVTDVFSAGWFWEINQSYHFSAELYYKDSKNRIDYIDHAELIDNPFIEAEIRSGKEKAYGIDVEIKKTMGNFTGAVSYSWSRALRKIKDINNVNWYSAPYDIPHDIRVHGNYKLNKRWSLSSMWVYTSGRPVTLPVGFYFEGLDAVPIYSERNSSRFPDYHRLDVAANYTNKATNKGYWDISFGIYNLYARLNPIGYEFDGFGRNMRVSQYSLFTILPNFSVKKFF